MSLPLLFAMVLTAFIQSECLVIEEYFDSIRSYEFVARFAFEMEPLDNTRLMKEAVQGQTIDPSAIDEDAFRMLTLTEGRLLYDIGYPVYSRPKLLVYQDFDDWTKIVEAPESSCFDIVQEADKVIELTENFVWGQSAEYDEESSIEYQNIVDSTNNAQSRGVVFFPEVATVRARWGAFILANCKNSTECLTSSTCQGPVVAKSDLHFLNESSELSYDDRGMQFIVLCFFLVELSVFILALHTRRLLKLMKKYHHTVKLLVYSVCLHLLSLFLQMVYWFEFASYGQPEYGLLWAGQYLTAMSNYLLIIMLILLGKGWTIVRSTISSNGVVKLSAYAAFYLVIVLFAQTYAYEYYSMTRSTVFFYASPPGVLVLLTRCVLGATWFFYAVHTTTKNFQIKKGFYQKFFWFGFIWMIAPAFFVLGTIGMSQLNWTVFTTVWENLLLQIAHLTLCTMYDPLAYQLNHSFPFHHTTCDQLSNTPWRTDLVDMSTLGVAAAKAAAGSSSSSSGGDEDAAGAEGDAVMVRGGVDPHKFKGRSAHDKGVKHVFKGMSIESRMHLTIADIYSDIKTQASAIIYIIQSLGPKIELFSELLEDWDVEDDGSEDDEKVD